MWLVASYCSCNENIIKKFLVTAVFKLGFHYLTTHSNEFHNQNRHTVTYSAAKKFIFVYSWMAKLARLKYANTIASRCYSSKYICYLLKKKKLWITCYMHNVYVKSIIQCAVNTSFHKKIK